MAGCIVESLAEKDQAEAEKGAARISKLSIKLLALIEDILTLTKVDIDDAPVGGFDFPAFGATAVEKFEAALAQTGVKLEFRFAHRRTLLVQQTRLTQVLENLIDNAIKYREPQKPTAIVTIRTFDTADRFFVRVDDNGLGIPAERQNEVFGMFKRFHGTTAPGSGLGLYIVRKQLAKLGAEITFESSPAGTSFFL